MKTLLLLLLPLLGFSQSLVQVATTGGIFAVSGGLGALVQADHFYPAQMKRAFPGYKTASETYYYKYKNGDPSQGPAYWGATDVLVWTTDPWHRLQFGENATKYAGVGMAVAISSGWKWAPCQKNWYEFRRDYKVKPWWAYPIESLVYWGAYNIGKELTFRLLK